ncbi:hypothetical protein AN639_01645 [Candidatus Epulonipiscium fishelsonii]|uniref:Uncharacterized protein n=1 Tax=Candidatus Epulonipiscium fishelsonii TaxID=77094 RepID=A0ACC8XAY7_9FIRM|nr:hypothetical protein AN639_01645 [Epulopiscium sp. SCG-B05WGA-EpuloA1]ONI39695.1 hypothetical protein AN396_07430 [Epulopiscium sp. SCG-B11WGA-EpuloA1]
MQYRDFTKDGKKVSLLGFGCMRFKSKNGSVDKELAFEQMYYAYENGVNYYDTAYIYHGGKSEVLLGEFIKKYDIRDKVFIADKLPGYLINKAEQIEEIYNTQLKRLDTTYIDYYLMHMLDSLEAWEKLKNLGILEFIETKKTLGEIKNIGFSFHGVEEEFIKILEDYPWDFCQIQYNYLDEHNQAGTVGLKRAYELGIGVVIMEPLRGGSLAAKAPDKVKEIFENYRKRRSPAFWGLRWVMNHKEVSVVLSGMNDLNHIKENIKAATLTTPNNMKPRELEIIEQVKQVYKSLMKVPCTGCNYCMPCPFGVAIPYVFSDYNNKYFFGKSLVTRIMYMARAVGFGVEKPSGANLCKWCGKCVPHCPQHIDIPVKLAEAHKELSNPVIMKALKIGKKFFKK